MYSSKSRSIFLELLSSFDDIEAQLATEYVTRARFILTTQMQADVTEDGYDFNGWILEFYQENCNGLVQVDGQGFFSPKGELIVDLTIHRNRFSMEAHALHVAFTDL